MKSGKVLKFVAWLVGVLTALAIGGSFISGLFMNAFLLSYLPLWFHQLVGWVILISTGVGVFSYFVK